MTDVQLFITFWLLGTLGLFTASVWDNIEEWWKRRKL